MEQDTVQLNTPSFDPNIDGPAAPTFHSNNTAVVFIQGLLNSPQPTTVNATLSQEENPWTAKRNTEYLTSQETYGSDSITE